MLRTSKAIHRSSGGDVPDTGTVLKRQISADIPDVGDTPSVSAAEKSLNVKLCNDEGNSGPSGSNVLTALRTVFRNVKKG